MFLNALHQDLLHVQNHKVQYIYLLRLRTLMNQTILYKGLVISLFNLLYNIL
jgi:hypothetical protein